MNYCFLQSVSSSPSDFLPQKYFLFVPPSFCLFPFGPPHSQPLKFVQTREFCVSSPIPIIHLRENIIPSLDVSQPFLRQPPITQFLINPRKPQHVLFHPLARIFGAGPRPQNKGPIARLRQQQLPPRLLQRPFLQRVRLCKPSRQLRHSFLRHIEVRINPLAFFVQPHPPIPALAPTRRPRRRHLVGRMPPQILLRRNPTERLLVVVRLPRQVIEKLRPFIPPMAEQFGIVRAQHQRWTIQGLRQPLHLGNARRQKMPGVLIGLPHCRRPLIHL